MIVILWYIEICDGIETYVPWFLYGTSRNTMVLPLYTFKIHSSRLPCPKKKKKKYFFSNVMHIYHDNAMFFFWTWYHDNTMVFSELTLLK